MSQEGFVDPLFIKNELICNEEDDSFLEEAELAVTTSAARSFIKVEPPGVRHDAASNHQDCEEELKMDVTSQEELVDPLLIKTELICKEEDGGSAAANYDEESELAVTTSAARSFIKAEPPGVTHDAARKHQDCLAVKMAGEHCLADWDEDELFNMMNGINSDLEFLSDEEEVEVFMPQDRIQQDFSSSESEDEPIFATIQSAGLSSQSLSTTSPGCSSHSVTTTAEHVVSLSISNGLHTLDIPSTATRPQSWKHSEQFEPVPPAPPYQENEHVGARKSPIEYFNHYIDDSVFEEFSQVTNQNYLAETGKILDSTLSEIKVFFGITITMSYLKYPQMRMYWAGLTRVRMIADCMPRDRYILLRSRLKLRIDNSVSVAEKEACKFWKLKPLIDRVREGCLKNPRSKILSIDEQMVPFGGHVAMREYVPGKPNLCGLKTFVAAASDGLPLDFFFYEGDAKSISNNPVYEPLDVGGKVVMHLLENQPEGTVVYMDKFFTSISLLDLMRSHAGVQGTGTLQESRRPTSAVFKTDLAMKREGRGAIDQMIRNDDQISLVKWYDSKPVILASSVEGSNPTDICVRWSKTKECYQNVVIPNAMKNYCTNMGGIDLLDRMIEHYRIIARTRKWTVRVIFHLTDFAAAAGWIMYKRDQKALGTRPKDQLDYLDFRRGIADSLTYAPAPVGSPTTQTECNLGEGEHHSEEEGDGPRRKRRIVTPHPPEELRTNQTRHLPEILEDQTNNRCRLPGCSSNKARVHCTTCKVFLCLKKGRNCFTLYHKRGTM